jgi:6-phosphogluconate dehydrogenase
MADVEGNAPPAQFGVIGLGVMGQNLALNVEEHGFSVAVWNRETDWVERFIATNPGKRLTGTRTLEEFAEALARPRRVLLMITAGDPVDMMIGGLAPLLDEGDILVDGGNSWFKDTQRREADLKQRKRFFVGCGVSGGEEGARFGPSLMPGGAPVAYEVLRPVLEAIAAQSDSGRCVTHVGPDGAGHFVKMVHNGIEYADMQLIAETYDFLKTGLGLQAPELADTFSAWNQGPLESFLIELTAKIFTVRDDETGLPLVDRVLDKAGQKGTGKWTAQVALDLAVPVPTITAALDARLLSSMKAERVAASAELKGPRSTRVGGDKRKWVAAVHDALYAAKICSYAQGMSLIRAGSEAYGWNINLREIARIWKGGCIIRARFLNEIMRAYDERAALANLLLDGQFRVALRRTQSAWRRVVGTAQRLGVPVPAMAASLAYFDSYRAAQLPQNLTQAQRDAFGAHTYERSDHPERGFVHTDWLKARPA